MKIFLKARMKSKKPDNMSMCRHCSHRTRTVKYKCSRCTLGKPDGWIWESHNGQPVCPHGIGHDVFDLHSCDGCCSHDSFAKKYEFKSK